MTENERILDQLRRAYRGGAFHGPAVFEILEGVDAERAARKPIPGAHSIWELALHVATWNRIPVRRIRERRAIDPTDAENFPPVADPSETAWSAAKEALSASADDVAATVETLPAERFAEIVPGRSYTVVAMLDGVIQHTLYHAGQMALVKKAAAKPVGAVGWLDLTVADAPGIRDFYEDVVGWTVSEVSMGGYSDFCMHDPETGAATAGVCHARGENTGLPPQWLMYLRVANLDESLARAASRGGKVVAPPRGFGGGRRCAVIEDPAGAVCAVYEEP